MENNKHPRRNSGRGILDVHPTQLRRGDLSDIKPEQLHIIEIDHKKRADAVKTKEADARQRPSATTTKKSINDPPNVPRHLRDVSVNKNIALTSNDKKTVRSEGNTAVSHKMHSVDAHSPLKPAPEKNFTVEQTKRSENIPKDNGEQRTRNIVNSILCGTLTVFLILGMIISVVHMSDKDKPVFSEYEKRPLEQMPKFTMASLTDGSYTHGIDSFFSDNFPMRETFVKNATYLKRFKGVRAFNKNAKQVVHGDSDIYSDGEMEILVNEDKFSNAETIVIPGLSDVTESKETENADINEESVGETVGENISDIGNTEQISVPDGDVQNSDDAQQTSSDEVTLPEMPLTENEAKNEPSGELKGDKRDTIYIIGDTAYEYFRGSTKSSDDYIKVINTYAKYIPENINVYTLVVPTHPEFGLTGGDRSVSNEQKPILDYIAKNLDTKIKFVNPYNNLLEAYNKGEYIYYRTDHHWTIRGAYCAYLEFCKTAGIEPVNAENLEKGRIEPFLGTFYSASGREKSLADNPDYVEYFVIDTPCTVTRYDKSNKMTNGKLFYRSVRGESNGYLAFMGGDFPYVHIKTENSNGRKLMIFKESFANPLIGLLAPHFEEIHVADIRYFKYNSVNFINQYGVTDVLFCNGIMSANSKARVNDLMELMNN